MDSDMDEHVEENLFSSDTEPLQPRIQIVDLDEKLPVVEESDADTSDVTAVVQAEDEGENNVSGDGGGEGGGDETQDVVEEVAEGDGEGAVIVEEAETGGDETYEVIAEGDDVADDGQTAGDDGFFAVEGDGTHEVLEEDASDGHIATHIKEWLNRAAEGAAELSEMETVEDQMRGIILEALEGIRDEVGVQESGGVEGEAKPADIRALLVDSLIKLPGNETGIDENWWILQELRAWVNTAMGIKTFVTKQTSTSTIDKRRGKIYDDDEEEVAEKEEDKDQFKEEVGDDVPKPQSPLRGTQTEVSHPPYVRRLSRRFPSAEVIVDKQSTSMVSFVDDEGQVYTQELLIMTKVSEIKTTLSGALNVPADVVGLLLEGCPMLDNLSLQQLGVLPSTTVDVRCFSTDPKQYPIHVSDLGKTTEEQKPEVLRHVMVRISEETIKDVVVEVADRSVRKPWLGGYRDTDTKEEFHHAFTQTQPRGKCMKAAGKTSRDTQTAEEQRRAQNTVSEKSTQMWRRDHYIPCDNDVIRTPGVYVTHAEIEARRNLLARVLTIQRYTRAWLLRRWVARMSAEYRRLAALEAEAERRRLEAKMAMIKRRITHKTYPRTRADFDMLYHMVEQWRLAEVARITRLRGDASKKAELYYLVKKEIVILSCIEKHRIRVKREKLRQLEVDFINKSAAPITWTGYKGLTVSMETGGMQNARELKQLYYSLGNSSLNAEQRIDLLITVKNALRPFDTCARVLDLVELLERECDCLSRGLTHAELNALRMRTRRTFVELLKDPALNPEGRPNRDAGGGDLLLCAFCRKLLPQHKFRLGARSRTMKHCVSCTWTDNVARPRIDYGPYRRIMREVRKEEARKCCLSSVAFLMQAEDFYYLIMEVWKSHSAIDKCDDLDDLVFSRWRVNEDWTPWNCVLLTYREARAHNRLRKSLEETYEEDFIEWVTVKHQEAKVHFRQLAKVDTRFKESGRWFKADLTLTYTPVH